MVFPIICEASSNPLQNDSQKKFLQNFTFLRPALKTGGGKAEHFELDDSEGPQNQLAIISYS
jgi:hypothetical protein